MAVAQLDWDQAMLWPRRKLLKTAFAAGGGLLVPRWLAAADPLGPGELPSGALEAATLHALPGKLALIKRTYRPPNYETPVSYFEEAFTPNRAFFVRYHVANIPEVGAESWKLKVGGEAAGKPFELSLAELKSNFEQVEVNALCMCSGNRRGLFQPHVVGIEWGHGAMGNARWKGARLKDILAKAELKKEALEIGFDGADAAVMEKSPDFIKSLPLWKALDENTLVAYEMNGEPLPHWNGFPVRLVVPGWTATYWMKHLIAISAALKPVEGFWMKPGYRIPKGKFPVVDRFVSQEAEANTPITEMVVNSLVTNIAEGARYAVDQAIEVKGVAWDGGYGIERVEVSSDGAKSWQAAELDKDLGKFSWRQWRHRIKIATPGQYVLMARAANRIGATQTFELIPNPAGYHHNVVQKITISIA
jgi:DMSO/TMAO reductase YedYZ molybdopterin-dependent catalytic subunit